MWAAMITVSEEDWFLDSGYQLGGGITRNARESRRQTKSITTEGTEEHEGKRDARVI